MCINHNMQMINDVNRLSVADKVHLLINLAMRDHSNEGLMRTAIAAGIGKYLKIKLLYENLNDIENCEVLHNTFYSFYAFGPNTAQNGNVNTNRLWRLIREGKNNHAVPELENVIEQISRNGTRQFSFSTKVRHTIDNSLPIFDSIVSKFFDIDSNRDSVNACVQCYDAFCNIINDNQDTLFELSNVFDNIFLQLNEPELNIIRSKLRIYELHNREYTNQEIYNLIRGITTAKKIDFMIWGYGTFINAILHQNAIVNNQLMDALNNDNETNIGVDSMLRSFLDNDDNDINHVAKIFRKLTHTGSAEYVYQVLGFAQNLRAVRVLGNIGKQGKMRALNILRCFAEHHVDGALNALEFVFYQGTQDASIHAAKDILNLAHQHHNQNDRIFLPTMRDRLTVLRNSNNHKVSDCAHNILVAFQRDFNIYQ